MYSNLRAVMRGARCIALAALLTGCDLGGVFGVPPDDFCPLCLSPRVELTPTERTLTVGDTMRLTATYYDAKGVVVPGVGFLWDSYSPVIATVDEKGFVIARAPGSARVVARAVGDPREGQADFRVVATP